MTTGPPCIGIRSGRVVDELTGNTTRKVLKITRRSADGVAGPVAGVECYPGCPAAGWSSLVARRAHNPKVVGSNPTPATTKSLVSALSGQGLSRSRGRSESPQATRAFGPKSTTGPSGTRRSAPAHAGPAWLKAEAHVAAGLQRRSSGRVRRPSATRPRRSARVGAREGCPGRVGQSCELPAPSCLSPRPNHPLVVVFQAGPGRPSTDGTPPGSLRRPSRPSAGGTTREDREELVIRGAAPEPEDLAPARRPMSWPWIFTALQCNPVLTTSSSRWTTAGL